MTGFFQLKDTNLGKYINHIGRILRVLNIDYIPRTIPDAVVIDDVLMCPSMEKGGFLVILFMVVELSALTGYALARYRNMGCGVVDTLAVR